MTVALLERVRSWLEDTGWWYGRLKPCSCPRSERYWGLQTHPPNCERRTDGAKREVTETDAATVVEWKRIVAWRCRGCGDVFEQETGVTVERDVRWHDDEGSGQVATDGGRPECPECGSAEQVREYTEGAMGSHTCDGCGMVFTEGGFATSILGPRPEVVDR